MRAGDPAMRCNLTIPSVLFGLCLFLFILPPVSAQTPEEYLTYFDEAVREPEGYDPSVVAREFERCELAFGNAPLLGRILLLKSRYLSWRQDCVGAFLAAAKAAVVFRESGARELLEGIPRKCPDGETLGELRRVLSPLVRPERRKSAQPVRARRFVLALLRSGAVEAERAIRHELEWYLAWYPQPIGADSVRVAWGDFLLRAGRPEEALAEYETVLQMFDASLLVPSLAPKTYRLARRLGRETVAQRAIHLAERSLRVATFSDSTVGAIFTALARMYLEAGEVGERELATFARALDEYRDFPFPADLLYQYAGLFEAAGDTEKAILCLQLFTARFPSDPRLSEAARRLRRLELALWQRQAEALRPFSTLLTQTERFRSPLSRVEIAAIKRALLDQINRDRRRQGLPPVRFDSLASSVADRHCAEALVNRYWGHFDLKGFKPHHRYAFAGGYHALTENFSSGTWVGFRANAERVLEMVLQAHARMFREKPPRDGHRRNILAPQHNYCGIGLAVGPRGYRFAEEFLDVYIRFDHIPRTLLTAEEAKAETLWVSGHAVNGARVVTASLDFEPWPEPLSPEEITRRQSYELPSFYTSLHRLIEQTLENGRVTAKTWWYWAPWSDFRFDFTEDRQRFKVPVVFHKGGPGIYTLSIWVEKEGVPGRFPATYLCFFVR